MSWRGEGRGRRFFGAGALLVAAVAGALALVATRERDREPGPPAPPPAPSAVQRFEADGVVVTFEVGRPGDEGAAGLREGDGVDVRFRIADAATGEPVRGVAPGAWMDLSAALGALPAPDGEAACRERVGVYLRGLVGLRPLVDLNGYHLLVLNQDPSLSVIDPVVGMTGRTSLFATVLLPGAGLDWVRSADGRRLWVSMPSMGEVAIVDTEAFRLLGSVDGGEAPGRVALSPDGRHLWIGDDAGGGVIVVDASTDEVLERIDTGRGHHELAFLGTTAFVTNRDDGTVTAIDVMRLEKRAELKLGPLPIALAPSSLSETLYVADGRSGEVVAVDPARLEVVARMRASPGLGPLRFSDDGRWGVVTHPEERAVHVIDAAANRIVHRLPMPGRPYQVAFTDAYAYVRLLDSERVPMIRLSSLGAGRGPIVQGFAAGDAPPGRVADLSPADSIVRAATEAAVFVQNPADGQTYFYMEGMNAPMGSFRNYGHAVRAATVIDRSLREVEPGVYASRVRLPVAGTYQVAFLLDAPEVLHCFTLEVGENRARRRAGLPLAIEYLEAPGRVRAGEGATLRFRLVDAVDRRPRAGLEGVAVRAAAVPARGRDEVPAREVGDGVYEAALRLPAAGAWYLHVGVPAEGIAFGALPFRAVLVEGEDR